MTFVEFLPDINLSREILTGLGNRWGSGGSQPNQDSGFYLLSPICRPLFPILRTISRFKLISSLPAQVSIYTRLSVRI